VPRIVPLSPCRVPIGPYRYAEGRLLAAWLADRRLVPCKELGICHATAVCMVNSIPETCWRSRTYIL
jgi:hypothetical protein